MVGVRVEVERSVDAIALLRNEINGLNMASRRPCPFSTYEYLEAFVAHDEHASEGQILLFLGAFEEGRLIGYLPLRRERGAWLGIPFERVAVLISHDTDRPHVVARAEDEARCCAAFYDYLVKRERSWAVLELAMQDSDSGLGVVPRLSPWRFRIRRFENMPNTTVPLPHATFADYYLSLGRSHRQNVSRLGRRLLASGQVEVLSCTDPRGRRAMLDVYLDLEKRSWKQEALAGVGRSAQRVAFFQALCEGHHPLQFGFDLVLFDGLPIAGLITGAFAERLYGLEMAFDRDHDDLGPGHLLSIMAIRRAINGGYRFLNFNGNYSYYKAKLGGVVTPTSAVQIFRVGTLPWGRSLVGDWRRRLSPATDEIDRFNPARRRVAVATAAPEAADAAPRLSPVRPARPEERERTRAALQSMFEQGIHLDRLSGSALERALPFSTRKEAA